MLLRDSTMLRVVQMAEGILSDKDYKSVKELAENREPELALEVLCEQLYEYEIRISAAFYNAILEAGQKHDLDPDFTVMIKPLVMFKDSSDSAG